MFREFGRQAIEFPSRRRTSIVVLRLNSTIFPVYSRKTGKRRNRDEFADDSPHRQFLVNANDLFGAVLCTRCHFVTLVGRIANGLQTASSRKCSRLFAE